jgi:hypothetical protein
LKIGNRRKTILILVIVVLLVLFSIALYFFLLNRSNQDLPTEPVSLESLGTSELPIQLPSDIDISEENIRSYIVKEVYFRDEIENMMDDLSLDLEEKEYSTINFIEWSDGDDKFVYDSITNILTFELSDPIFLGEEKESLKTIFLKYFDRSYDFEISEIERVSGDLTNYYARRLVEDLPIEKGSGYEYSDIIRVNGDGFVIGGSILLTELVREDSSLPIVDSKELQEYVNLTEYPKESYVYASQIMDTIGLSYLDPRWEEIHSSASNCKSSDIELIYLYKSVNQGVLYPVFKVLASCEIDFEDEIYNVPGIFYINAVDPEYVITE